jgi:protein phosphatase
VLNSVDLPEGIDGLYIVADGMGGRASGAEASSIAVSALRDAFVLNIKNGEDDLSKVLTESLKAANAAVYSAAQSDPKLAGMGTTCVAVAVKDGHAYFAHLGDSRAYLLRDGNLERLTDDHSFVAEKVKTRELTEEQARKSRFRNVITRAVGLEPDAVPDVGKTSIHSGDVILLCTDGLTTPVKESNIADILCTSSSPAEACDQLIAAALWDGGKDNITAIVAAFGTPVKIKSGTVIRPEKRRGGWIAPAFLGILVGIGLGLYPGHDLLVKYLPKHAATVIPVEKLDLAHVSYSEPRLLLSNVPLQGRIIAIDRSGFIYVADVDGKLMRVDTAGRVDTKYPIRSTFKFFVPTHAPMLASDDQGNTYIADPAGRRILKFTANGALTATIGVGKLDSPEATAVDKYGNVYVVDDGRLKVLYARPQTAEEKTYGGRLKDTNYLGK